MKKPPRPLVLAVLVPFLQACYGVVAQPLPESGARPTGDVRGLVVDGPEGERRVEADPLHDMVWSDSAVVLTGVFKSGTDDSPPPGTVQTRSFPRSDVTGVLVRGLEGTKTSIIVSALIVGTSAIVATLVTGQSDEGTVFPGG